MYGGAAHDSFVWKHSMERQVLQENFENNILKNVWLLGTYVIFTVYPSMYITSLFYRRLWLSD